MQVSLVDDKKFFFLKYFEYFFKVVYSELWVYIVNMIWYFGGEWIIIVCFLIIM